MVLNWLLFAIIANFLWGIAVVIDKFVLEKHIKEITHYTFFTCFLSIIVIFVIPFVDFRIVKEPVILLAAVFHVLGIYFFFKAASKEEISRVIPLFSFVPLLVLLFSHILIRERLIFDQYVGFIFLVVGGFMISIKRVKGIFRLRPAFYYMVISSFFYAFQAIVLKRVFSVYNTVNAFITLNILIFLIVLTVFILYKKLRANIIKSFRSLCPKSKFAVFLSRSLGILAFFFFAKALVSGPVSLIEALVGIEFLSVFIIAILLSLFIPKIIKEELNKKVLILKAVSILLIAGGLVFINI